MTDPIRSVVLTGASGGLGRALAAELAAPGRRMLLMGRDAQRLAEAAGAARARGAEVETAAVPLTETAALSRCLREFDVVHPVDLLIANAGVKTGNRGGIEPVVQAERVIAVNLTATIHAVQALLPAMRARRRGRIAIVGSLAAVAPHGDLLSYSATKAGLQAYATALRRSLAGSGVGVTTVIPGFMDTPMTDRQKGPAPMLMPPARAARIVARGLERGRATIAFPLPLIIGAWLGERLPAPLADRIMARYRAEILPDPDEAAGG